ncbi:hypothetical protein NSMM_490070 [Nitrosomonas mobilis]|uniref:Uncharacterized protein n=1 Tax=Nitrosomonas mobilis TaxID=51642 RepID=A0A1G5SI02_9PROT|nr:hypothetical protein NSMM_490070 [Nitrosomonas mobilis]
MSPTLRQDCPFTFDQIDKENSQQQKNCEQHTALYDLVVNIERKKCRHH